MASQNISYWRTGKNINQVFDKNLKSLTDLNQYPALYADHPVCDDRCQNRTELHLPVTPNPALPALLERCHLHFHPKNFKNQKKNQSFVPVKEQVELKKSLLTLKLDLPFRLTVLLLFLATFLVLLHFLFQIFIGPFLANNF